MCSVGEVINKRMLKILLICLFTALYPVDKVLGQKPETTDMIDGYIDMILDIDDENIQSAEIMKEDLYDLLSSPIDINHASREELERLPFLNQQQVENILYYVYVSGGMKSADELRLVEGLDLSAIRLLRPFIRVESDGKDEDDLSIAEMFRYGRSRLTAKYKNTLRRKRGYANVSDSMRSAFPGSYYAGKSFYNSVKYAYSYKDRMSIGFSAEKDPGEEFFRGSNRKGYDFYSLHFFLKGKGRLKAFAAGDYRASFGKGLVINNDFYMGKNIYSSTMFNRKGGLRKHSSTDETSFLRGTGATLSFGDIDVTLFYSFRNMDASVDSVFISSLKTDGYHRLQRDLKARNTVQNHLTGSNIRYDGRFFNIELTAVYNVFNKVFKSDNGPYSVFYPSGRHFLNVGVAYNFRWKNIFVGGETAIDGNGHFATLNSVNIYPSNGYRLFLLHRYYDYRYSAIYASSFASGGRVQNESGLYGGIEASFTPEFRLTLAFDSYRYPWLKYGVDRPSSGNELSLRATYFPSENLTFYADYRFRASERDYRDDAGLENTYRSDVNKLRLFCGYTSGDILSLNSIVDCNFTNIRGLRKYSGVALSQSLSCNVPWWPVRVSATYSIFDTDDYISRIYVPSRNLPESFYYPAVYGRGIYFSAVARYDIAKRVMLALRYSLTCFENVTSIGSGPEEIAGNKRDDIGVMLVVRF